MIEIETLLIATSIQQDKRSSFAWKMMLKLTKISSPNKSHSALVHFAQNSSTRTELFAVELTILFMQEEIYCISWHIHQSTSYIWSISASSIARGMDFISWSKHASMNVEIDILASQKVKRQPVTNTGGPRMASKAALCPPLFMPAHSLPKRKSTVSPVRRSPCQKSANSTGHVSKRNTRLTKLLNHS